MTMLTDGGGLISVAMDANSLHIDGAPLDSAILPVWDFTDFSPARQPEVTGVGVAETAVTSKEQVLGADDWHMNDLSRRLGLRAVVGLSAAALGVAYLCVAVNVGTGFADVGPKAAPLRASHAPIRLPSSARGSNAEFRNRLGLSTHLLWMPETRALSLASRLAPDGFDWIRDNFQWAAVEPDPRHWDWSATDTLMTVAARSHVHVLAILGATPSWDSTAPRGVADYFHYPPKRLRDFARYAAAVTRRYGPRGTFWRKDPTLPADPLTAVEVWDEPYGYWSWRPQPSPPAYAALTVLTARAVHAVSPTVSVLASGQLDAAYLKGNRIIHAPWIGAVLAAQPRLSHLINAYAVHPYPNGNASAGPYQSTTNPLFSYGALIRRPHELELRRHAALPEWITEVGWTDSSATNGVTAANQAAYDVGAVRRAIQEYGQFVSKVFIYSYSVSPGDHADALGNYGLLKADGEPRPAYLALARLMR